jgi:PilZ domain
MEAGVSTARKARAEHRRELRTLTYLTVDHATSGVIRDLNQTGIGVQMVRPLRPGERVRICFELPGPKLRVETLGEVVWTTGFGQCGIRFLNLPRAMRQQINEWILSDLLESASLHAERSGSAFACRLFEVPRRDESDSAEISTRPAEEDDGLVISGTPAKVITLPRKPEPLSPQHSIPPVTSDETLSLDWLSQPLSSHAIARCIDTLAVVAAFFLFVLIFLSITRDAPPWPFSMAAGGIVLVGFVYRGFFWVFGGVSLGTRLARKAGTEGDKEKKEITE